MILTLQNIREYQRTQGVSVVERARVIGNNNKPTYKLLKGLDIQLSNGEVIHIPKGFVWDLSSVPRPLWGALPPDGDFELASLIHDYLYTTRHITRCFADYEMLLWSKSVSGTSNVWSLRNFDNWVRYIGVVIGGWWKWYDLQL